MFSILRRSRKGQGMTEYIIIVALIAIATIAVVKLFGNNIRGLFAKSTNALTGTAKEDIKLKKASQGTEVNRGLSDFEDGAAGGAKGKNAD